MVTSSHSSSSESTVEGIVVDGIDGSVEDVGAGPEMAVVVPAESGGGRETAVVELGRDNDTGCLGGGGSFFLSSILGFFGLGCTGRRIS